MTRRTTLYFDLGSPYAYLALERVESVLGRPAQLEPVLLGALFSWRGRGSWALEAERAQRMAEVQERAERYGLPPIEWPACWPANGLAAMRAATWAALEGGAEPFARAVYRCQFRDGADISDRAVLAGCARQAGLDPGTMLVAIESAEVKEALKQSTQRAWDVGVRGIPTLLAGGIAWYGDDQLEHAAIHLNR